MQLLMAADSYRSRLSSMRIPYVPAQHPCPVAGRALLQHRLLFILVTELVWPAHHTTCVVPTAHFTAGISLPQPVKEPQVGTWRPIPTSLAQLHIKHCPVWTECRSFADLASRLFMACNQGTLRHAIYKL